MKQLYKVDKPLVVVVASGEFDRSVKRFVEYTQSYVSEVVGKRYHIPNKTRKARKRFGSVLESRKYRANTQQEE